MAPAPVALLSTIVAILLLPGFTKDLPLNGTSPAHRGRSQGVSALPQRVNASSLRNGGNRGAQLERVNASSVFRNGGPAVVALPQQSNASSLLHRGDYHGVMCSVQDRLSIVARGPGNAHGTFPKLLADCGKEARTLFWWSADKFVNCIKRNAGLSQPCAECMLIGGQYGWSKCKWSCLFRPWCGHDCLNCVEPVKMDVDRCAGLIVPRATPCR